MKSLKKIFWALMICAIAISACSKEEKPDPPPPPPPPPGDMPEVAPVSGKVVIVFNAVGKAEVCGDIVFAGDYGPDGDWVTDPAVAAKFVAIPDWPGWFKAEVTPSVPGGALRGKPNHLADDGTFPSDWAHQWFPEMEGENIINDCEILEGDAELTIEHTYEKRLDIAAGADVVYIRGFAWKRNPCVPPVTYDITFNVTVPAGLGADDIVYIVGGMNNWMNDGVPPTPLTKTSNPLVWTVSLPEVMEGTEYKYIVNAPEGGWDFRERGDISDDPDCADDIDNRKVNDRTMNDVVKHFAGITTCLKGPEQDYTFVVTVPENTPEDAVIRIVGAFGSAGYPNWDPAGEGMELTKGSDGKWTITLEGVAGGTEYKYVMNAADKDDWSNEELTANCVGISNRKVGADPTQNDEVEAWKGYCAVIREYTIVVTVPEGTPDAVFIAGDFNNWSITANKLVKGSDGTYSITAEMEEGSKYKFLLNSTWENVEVDIFCDDVPDRRPGSNVEIKNTVGKWKSADCEPDTEVALGDVFTWVNNENQAGFDLFGNKPLLAKIGDGSIKLFALAFTAESIEANGGINGIDIIFNANNPVGWSQMPSPYPWGGWINYAALVELAEDSKFVSIEDGVVYFWFDISTHTKYAELLTIIENETMTYFQFAFQIWGSLSKLDLVGGWFFIED